MSTRKDKKTSAAARRMGQRRRVRLDDWRDGSTINESSMRFKGDVVDRLRRLIRREAQSVAAVERLLGRKRGYVGDALRSKKVLTVDLILDVLTLLKVNPWAFFAGDL